MSVYRERAAVHLRTQLPSAILDIVLDFLVSGRRDYGVCAQSPVQLPEFDFLYNKKKWSATFLKWEQRKIANISNFILTNDVDESFCSSLLEMSRQSLVGKNEKTVLDETVRKSSEITADQIQLDPEFHARISSEIQQLAQTLGHPTKVIAKLYKLVIYKEGDFFDTHVDSPHANTEPMIFTASVQLNGRYWSSGGELMIGDEEIRSARSGELGLALFYYDQPHSVKRLERGYRLRLIFDVVDSGVPNPDFHVMDASAAFANVISMGFNNVAIQSSYSYFASKQVTAEQLKGSDKVFCEAALAAGAKNIEICRVYAQRGIFREEVLELMQIDHSFSTLYAKIHDERKPARRAAREQQQQEEEEEAEGEAEEGDEGDGEKGEEEEDEEEEDNEEEAPKKRQKRAHEETEADENEEQKEPKEEEEEEGRALKRSRIEYDSLPSPRYAEGRLVAVKDEYRLGDTLFLATVAPPRLEFCGKESVSLGNEGFCGEIYSNLAIIAHF